MAVFKLLEPDNPVLKVKLEDCNSELNRQELKDNLSGLQCRIFQHEYDHMEGSDFTKKVGKLKLDLALKKQKKMEDLAKKLKMKTEARLERDRQNQILMS